MGISAKFLNIRGPLNPLVYLKGDDSNLIRLCGDRLKRQSFEIGSIFYNSYWPIWSSHGKIPLFCCGGEIIRLRVWGSGWISRADPIIRLHCWNLHSSTAAQLMMPQSELYADCRAHGAGRCHHAPNTATPPHASPSHTFPLPELLHLRVT